MIQIDNICFSYDSAPLIDGLSAQFDDGSITGILGANGSRKSTLLKPTTF